MSSWNSLVPSRGFSYADPISANYARRWEPNSRNPLVCFLINNVSQSKLIVQYITAKPEELNQLGKASRYLESIDVYLIKDRKDNGSR